MSIEMAFIGVLIFLCGLLGVVCMLINHRVTLLKELAELHWKRMNRMEATRTPEEPQK